MRFTVVPSVFSDAVKAVSKIVPKSPSMPVLSNILVRPSGEENVLIITACDGDNTLSVSVSVDESEGLFPILLPADNVSNALSVMGQLPVTVEVDKDEVVISDFMGEYRFMGSADVAQFPASPDVSGPSFTLPAYAFAEVAQSAARFVAKDDLRLQMCGVFFDFKPDSTMDVAASDTKRLFYDNIGDVVMSGEPASMIIHSNIIGTLVSLLSMGTKGDVTITTDGNRVRFDKNGTTIIARLVDGKFPRFQAVMPKNNDRVATVVRASFVSAIERASVAANASTNQLKIAFDGVGAVTIESRDVDFSTSAKVRATTEQQTNLDGGLSIGVRGALLLDVLKNAFKGCQNVIVKMHDPSRAILIKEDDHHNRTALVMPMQLADF